MLKVHLKRYTILTLQAKNVDRLIVTTAIFMSVAYDVLKIVGHKSVGHALWIIRRCRRLQSFIKQVKEGIFKSMGEEKPNITCGCKKAGL